MAVFFVSVLRIFGRKEFVWRFFFFVSVLRIFGRKEFRLALSAYVGISVLKVCTKCILEELDYVVVFSVLCKTIWTGLETFIYIGVFTSVSCILLG